jgi:hypothetical protein
LEALENPGWGKGIGTDRGADERTLVKWLGKRGMHPVHGAIAQLGERVVRNDEAVGSIPTSSTNFNPQLSDALKRMLSYFGCPASTGSPGVTRTPVCSTGDIFHHGDYHNRS